MTKAVAVTKCAPRVKKLPSQVVKVVPLEMLNCYGNCTVQKKIELEREMGKAKKDSKKRYLHFTSKFDTTRPFLCL